MQWSDDVYATALESAALNGPTGWEEILASRGGPLAIPPGFTSTIPQVPSVLTTIGNATNIAANLCQLFPSLCGPGATAIVEQPPQTTTGLPVFGLTVNARPCPPGRRLSGTICKKIRRMNPLNPKALNRAARRMAGFHTFAVKAEKELQKIVRKGGFRAPAKRSGCGTCGKTKCGCR